MTIARVGDRASLLPPSVISTEAVGLPDKGPDPRLVIPNKGFLWHTVEQYRGVDATRSFLPWGHKKEGLALTLIPEAKQKTGVNFNKKRMLLDTPEHTCDSAVTETKGRP